MWDKVKRNMVFRLLWFLSTTIAMSLRMKISGAETIYRLADAGKGLVILVWHNSTIIPIYYFRNQGYYAISSVSRDGELQSKLLASRGFKLIRGSSARGGVKVLLESAKKLRDGGVLALTPDGPRGPNKEVQAGSIQLASRAGCPVVAVGVACERGMRVHSWDSHLIPGYFSRAALYVSQPFYIDETSKPVEEWCEYARDVLNDADEKAAEMLGGKVV